MTTHLLKKEVLAGCCLLGRCGAFRQSQALRGAEHILKCQRCWSLFTNRGTSTRCTRRKEQQA